MDGGQPVFQPMLATLGDEARVRGGGWQFEVKWDGYRGLAHHPSDGRTVLRSRGGLDLLPGLPELRELDDLLEGHDAVVDGEVVCLLDDGRSDFEALQNRHRPGARPAHLMAFDLLHLDGTSLLALPLASRRELLEALLGQGSEHVHVPTTFGDDADLALGASRELRLEGLIAKRENSGYEPGRRSENWLKVKNFFTQEVVVVGWKPGSGGRAHGLGSLLLAVPGADALECVGSAGSGFSQASLAEALARLEGLARTSNPGVVGVRPEEARGNHWVEPELVGEVSYAAWTAAGRLRHPVWRGFRDDLSPAEVTRGEG